jgi:pectinesterase
MRTFILPILLVLGSTISPSVGRQCTEPPAGAVIVKPNTNVAGEFSNLGEAVNSLPADNTSQVVFVYPGLYVGQVNVSRAGPVTVRHDGATTIWALTRM